MRHRSPLAPASAVGAIVTLLFLACSGSGGSRPEGTRVQESASPAAGSSVYVPDTKPAPAAHWVEATLPKGTIIHLALLDRLGPPSGAGDSSFRARVTGAVIQGSLEVVPVGSNVQGVVSTEAVTGTGNRDGKGPLVLSFNWIGTTSGATADLVSNPIRTGAKRLEAGTPFDIVLEQPLRIKVKTPGGPS
jgi:hypothetical protein